MCLMNKRFLRIFLLVFLFLLLMSSTSFADKGIVAKEHNGKCAISNNMGFLLVEWYGGHIPREGDFYVGNFSTYGFKELYCLNVDSTSRFWTEDFMASEDDAWEFLYD